MSGNSFSARLRRVLCGAVCLALIFAATEYARAKIIASVDDEIAKANENAALASLPPINEPLVPAAVPVAMRSLVQAQLLGGGDVPTNSWHLSVINGGQPRGGQGESQTRPVFTTSWPGASLNQGQWTFRSLDDEAFLGDKSTLGAVGGAPAVGDFNGDGRTEIGVFVDGQWYIDLNGNGAWDDNDLRIGLGRKGDLAATGDWDGDGKTDVGVFGGALLTDAAAKTTEAGLPDASNRTTGEYKNLPVRRTGLDVRSLQRTAGGAVRADRMNHVLQFGAPGDAPVTGDWNGDGVASVGIFREGHWVLDTDGDGKFSASDVSFNYGIEGDLPVVGDFNADGVDEIGVFRNGVWFLDTNGNRSLDADDLTIEFGSAGDLPVVGDFTGTGSIQLGLYRAVSNTAAQR
jgi:hypothetical protein